MLSTIIALAALILISAFFSGSETGMMAINRYRLQHLAKTGKKSALRIQALLKRPDRLLGVILIGNTFANILASALATLVAIHYFGEKGIVISTITLTFIILIFSEVAPKTVAALFPEPFATIVSLPLKWLLWLCYPLVWLINTIANGLLKLCRINVGENKIEPLSSEEIRHLVHTASNNLASKDKSMLLGIFELNQVSVNDIMLPRNDIVGINLDDSLEEIKQQLQSLQHTRVPLYSGNIDKLEGILHIRKIVSLLGQPHFNHDALKAAITPAYFIPEEVSLTSQLLRFQKQRQRLAFVVDEYGEIQGLLTIDDILEEVVGDFTTDISDTSKNIHPQKDGSYLVDGSTPLRELNKELQLSISTEGPKTLNGFITEQLETIPKVGMQLSLKSFSLEIIHAKKNKVITARLFISPGSNSR